MPNIVDQTRCPYTTLPLSESSEVNEEHILPMALGAPASFTVPATAAENTRMNDLIDAPVINDPLIRFIAMTQGVVSRSGLVSAQLDGELQGSGEAVRASLNLNGADFRFANPVIVDDATGKVKAIQGFGEAADNHAKRVKRNYAKKGVAMEIGDSQVTEKPWLKFGIPPISEDLIRQELIKIAYLMTVRLFGDDAILSQSGKLFRAAMLATTIDEMKKTGIRGGALNSMPNLLPPQMPNIFPRPMHNEHAITCFVLGRDIVSAVTLFGMFNALFVTPAVGFAATEGAGEIIRINVSTSTLSSRSFLDSIVDIQAQLGGA